MTLGISELLNWIMGGGLVAALTALITIGPTVRKARGEAEKAHAEAEANRIDNAEHATRILMANIVEPLQKELESTRKEFNATKREMARLRKAIDGASSCEHRSNCPVLNELRDPKANDDDRANGDGTLANDADDSSVAGTRQG